MSYISKMKEEIRADIEFCEQLSKKDYVERKEFSNIVGKYIMIDPYFEKGLKNYVSTIRSIGPNEIENLSRPIYGYTDKSSLKLTGVARYDGLKSNEQRQILITPTWRRNIANANVAHVKKGHNEYFKNSEYYRIYNTLINDSKYISF